MRGPGTRSRASNQRRGEMGPPWRTPRVTGMGPVADRKPGTSTDILLPTISWRTAAATVGGTPRRN
eukprot:6463663-Alexandrium_andersonii.AAC.1